jgi:hypothetical protein
VARFGAEEAPMSTGSFDSVQRRRASRTGPRPSRRAGGWLGLLVLAPLLACSNAENGPASEVQAEAGKPADTLIVAGERVGEWELGQDLGDRSREEIGRLLTELAHQGVMIRLGRERVYGKVQPGEIGSFILPTYSYDGITFMIREDQVQMVEIAPAG